MNAPRARARRPRGPGPGAPLRASLAAAVGLAVVALGGAGGRAGASGGAARPSASSPFRFTDVTESSGIDFVHVTGATGRKYPVETMGSGAAFVDYDLDGDPDLLLINGAPLPGFRASGPVRPALYRNDGHGRFVDVTRAAGLAAEGYGMGVAVGDYDDDGDPDLYVTRWGPDALYRNEGDGTFRDVTAAAGVGDARWSASAAWADLDGDGALDLYVTHYMDWSFENDPECWNRKGPRPERSYCLPDAFRGLADELYWNRRDGTFEAGGRAAGVARADGKGLGVVAFDDDGDGRLDVYVANDTTPNFFFHNLGGRRFEERGLLAGLAYDADGNALAGMGVDAADYDSDGDLDVFVTNFQGESNTLYRRESDGFFVDRSRPAGIARASLDRLGFGTAFADLDDDGWADLVVANGHLDSVTGDGSAQAQPNQFFRNLGDGRFAETPPVRTGPERVGVSRGLALADIDGDGDLDVLFTNSGSKPELLRNDSPGGGAVRLRLVGAPGHRDPVGARITLSRVGGRRERLDVRGGGSYLSQSEAVVHVGLGGAEHLAGVEVRWPGGSRDALGPLAGGRLYVVVEGRGVTESQPFSPPSH